MTEVFGGKVAKIESRSIAEEAGILPGDIVVSINGHPISDIIDYRFYLADEDINLIVRRGEEEAEISIEKDYDDPLGIDFEDELFDGVRTCGNRCLFCFVHQLPQGMRPSLYLRDDDYRLSFLHGNFVTLTNVDEKDIDRIIEQRLTPLYVSVHSTDPKLRSSIIRNEHAPDIMQQLHTLAAGKITIHTQIVVCPGVNDGKKLEQTIHDLASLYPGVASIGVVPVGLTRHRLAGPAIDAMDPVAAGKIVQQVRRWQKKLRKDFGSRLVWASDELYLASGIPVPSASSYEGFPQLENGIGIVRQFIDDTRKTIARLPERIPHPVKATVVTSTLATPIIEEFTSELNKVEDLHVYVAPIMNEFFGESVTVTGLLTGKDIINQLKGHDLGDFVLIPTVMLRDGVFLDNITLSELSEALSCPAAVIEPTPSALADKLIGEVSD
ncbi:MAG: DUF512 domain-containing protein [Armatimonadota bacterium]